MPNYGAKILNNAVASLTAQQAVIATTGNNIANVNTPGYTRRVAELNARGSGSSTSAGSGLGIGNGVEVAEVRRVTDQFLESILRDAKGTKSEDDLKVDYLSRLENLFALDGSQPTIGGSLEAFFTSINQLSGNPSSIELRSNVIQRGTDLVNIIKDTYKSIADLQTELDQRLTNEVNTVNSLTSQIADLNKQVSFREAGGQEASDERDQRDVLLGKLAEKISFSVIENNSGEVNVYLPSGFTLVNGGTSRALSVTNSPDFAAGALPPSLGGGVLSYVVYDYVPGSGTAHLDLTQGLQAGTGTIGAILQLRGYASTSNTSAFQADGTLVQAASRIEALTRTLLTSVNQTYHGPDENPGLAGFQASSGDLDGGTPSTFGLFDFSFSGTKDADSDGLAELTDLTATGRDNFSSVLQFGVSDPRKFAASRDLDLNPGAVTFPPGDSQSAQALVALRTTSFSYALGSYSFTGTFADAANEIVGYIGNRKAEAVANLNVSTANLTTVSNKRDAVSAVSLDEEFSSLIKFQKAYQASARMIKTAEQLLDELVSLI